MGIQIIPPVGINSGSLEEVERHLSRVADYNTHGAHEVANTRSEDVGVVISDEGYLYHRAYDGNDAQYVLVAHDISDPSNPVEAGRFAGTDTAGGEGYLKIDQEEDLLVMVSGNVGGENNLVSLWDISQGDNPQEIDTADTDGEGLAIDQERNYVWVSLNRSLKTLSYDSDTISITNTQSYGFFHRPSYLGEVDISRENEPEDLRKLLHTGHWEPIGYLLDVEDPNSPEYITLSDTPVRYRIDGLSNTDYNEELNLHVIVAEGGGGNLHFMLSEVEYK